MSIRVGQSMMEHPSGKTSEYYEAFVNRVCQSMMGGLPGSVRKEIWDMRKYYLCLSAQITGSENKSFKPMRYLISNFMHYNV